MFAGSLNMSGLGCQGAHEISSNFMRPDIAVSFFNEASRDETGVL